LEIATLGGAQVLGRADIGCIAPGMSADLIAISLDRPALAGAEHDPVAALILCQLDAVDYSFINGRKVVDRGILTTIELPRVLRQTQRLAADMTRGPGH